MSKFILNGEINIMNKTRRHTFALKVLFMTIIGSSFSQNTFAHNSTHSNVQNLQTENTNPFLQESVLPYHAPQFDKININDYIPAFNLGIKEQNQEIETITKNSNKPTFENTIVALENSGAILNRVSRVFTSLSSVMANDEIIKIQDEIDPKLTAHYDNIYLNTKLFERVKRIYKKKNTLEAEQIRLVEFYYNNFVRAGAELSEANKKQMRTINVKISALENSFSQNILNSFKTDTILVTDKKELDGLSKEEMASLASAAKLAGQNGYLISLVNTTDQPILAHLSNRELRQTIYEKSANRLMDVNPSLAIQLAHLRAEKANLLGYTTWAHYVLADQMAETTDAAFDILDNLAPKAVNKAKIEAIEIQSEIKKDGKNFELKPWDWSYYAEKVRKEKYNLDQAEVKPYFEFNTVLKDGLFYAMNRLYGVYFKERFDLPVWHKDVLVFEVFNKDNSELGLFYLDPYARDGKSGGAWMDELVTQSTLLNNKPVVYNALNIPKPAEGNPVLMTFDEVTTMFHEFGHAVHGLFSDVKYPSLAGTATARDFVEFPSQFHEDFSINPEILSHYAKHYKTGKPIPQGLLKKIMASHKFNSGFEAVEYLSAAILDMEWHSISKETKIDDINDFEKSVLKKHGISFASISPRYKANYFSHIFNGGYSAGYYAYIWTEVLAADAFAFMETIGGLTLKNGNNFRNTILSKGNSQDLMQNYVNYRGKRPSIDALLKRRGLD